jgi:hypothetical protein
MEITQILIIPSTDINKVSVTLSGVDDQGKDLVINAKSSLILSALSTSEIYAVTQGDPIPIVTFIANQLLDSKSFFYAATMASLKSAIESAGEKELADLYNDLNGLFDAIALRNDKLTTEKGGEDAKTIN